ncbi:cyclopropane fatty-acyl-phospholipid synthase-like methyltransferase [Saccharothrix carnea]|uniref:Cyclopropane fatty-acyl-phospholipid synthase-like methyltransferase n=1 Tax=Saccharothrix carnea TaxID=1280637 RepID=A0A2P8HD02_SACCR|nr:methyltransferase domain-containing protein [Saccharothrix carnea]PSL44106.1 cyclopropane fatty-acyl-phospholipid synthase-like methyltransferase [Saccharothrix carnea]
MSSPTRQEADEVGEIYDEMSDLVDVYYGNIHLGYWADDDDPTPLRDALERMTDLVVDALELAPGQHLLDVGCGVGEPAIRIAARSGVRITGISNSAWHVEETARRVTAAGVGGLVTARQADAGALPFPNATFDAVLALDSLPNAVDKGQWLREVGRVLRPGGRFALTDYTAEVPLTPADREVIATHGIFDPPTAPALCDLVSDAGLVVEQRRDWGARARRTYDEVLSLLHHRREAMADAYGSERMRAFEDSLAPVLEVCRAKLGYLLVAGHRPG